MLIAGFGLGIWSQLYLFLYIYQVCLISESGENLDERVLTCAACLRECSG
jgi:hypothetical protein